MAATPPSTPMATPQVSGEEKLDERHFERVRWRCRRGLLELDVILKEFLDEQYLKLTVAEQLAFDQLLTTQDHTLLAYMHGVENPPENELMKIVTKIRK